MQHKSPFYVVQELLSPLLCEQIVGLLDFFYPDTDPDDNPVKTVKTNDSAEEIVFDRFEPHIQTIMEHYGTIYRGTEPMTFEWYPQLCLGEQPRCESSAYIKKKWTRIKDRDFTCVIFLSQYQERTPFDSDFEVYGGKLEFPQHDFGFNPQIGTMIVFPSGQNFINDTAPILAGDLYQVRFHVATQIPFVYNPSEFMGDYTTWFEHLA